MNNKLNQFISNTCESSITDINSIDKLKGSILFVTGCGGFVGRWLLEFILQLNNEHDFKIKVYATSRIWDFNNNDLDHLFKHNNFQFTEIDVRNSFAIPTDVQKVIHLAASPDRKEIASDPLKLINTVVQGTSNLLEAVSDHGNVDNILNFTSGYVNPSRKIDSNGDSTYSFLDTSDLMAVYIESKRMSEVLCNVHRRRFQMNLVNVRPYAFIGPFMNLNKVWAINNFFLDAINKNPITVSGDKRTIRSYLLASDMAFTICVLLCDPKHKSSVDLGSLEAVSLEDLALRIQSIYPTSKSISVGDLDENNEGINVFVPELSANILDMSIVEGRSNLGQSLNITKEWLSLNE